MSTQIKARATNGQRGKYARVLADVYLNGGIFLNAEIVKIVSVAADAIGLGGSLAFFLETHLYPGTIEGARPLEQEAYRKRFLKRR